jgi:diguanylate cyclase (GGDEF)-like protein
MVAADRELDSGVEGEPAGAADPGVSSKTHAPIEGFAVVLRDVTERRVTGEQLRRLLTTDYLTGATNRGHFFDLAEAEFARHSQQDLPISALMLDLDHFKTINDCFGHAAGDGVLKRLVEVCRAQLRASDVLARMGGEEFAVLLPDTTLPEAQLIAERMCRSISADIELPPGGCLGGTLWQSGRVGVSIGCAATNASIVGVDALLNAADAALYAAKRAGRGRVQSAGQDAPALNPGLTKA